MLDLPLVDTHLHLWDPERLDYPWLRSLPAIRRPFTIHDYQEAVGSVEVARMVFVQADCLPEQTHREVELVMEAAAIDPRLSGIVAFAPLEQGDRAVPDLEMLAANRLVKGVRRLLQGESDPEFCLRPDFVRGVHRLAELGLHFEITITRHQLPAAIRLAAQCPDVRFMLDHIANPNIKEGEREPWRAQLAELARRPNVWCKVSGVVTNADREDWEPDDLRPYIEHVIGCFGFDRLVFGSDWPVLLLAGDIPRWVDALDRLLAGCSRDERQRLFSRNALAFYRLDED